MGKLNLLKKDSNMITFIGFDKINDVITLKIFGNRLVIIPEKLDEMANRSVFILHQKQSDDKKLLKIINDCCKKENTVFIEDGGIYYQAENVSTN